MTCNMSAKAVCCSSAAVTSRLLSCRSFNSFELTTAIAAWSANAASMGASFSSNGRISCRYSWRSPIHSSSWTSGTEAARPHAEPGGEQGHRGHLHDRQKVVPEGRPAKLCRQGTDDAAPDRHCLAGERLQSVPIHGDGLEGRVSTQHHNCGLGVTQLSRLRRDRVQDRADVTRVGADEAHDIANGLSVSERVYGLGG